MLAIELHKEAGPARHYVEALVPEDVARICSQAWQLRQDVRHAF